MRSRYTAFATGNVDYIVGTHDTNTVRSIDRRGTEKWAKESEWLGLEVLGTDGGQEDDKEGTVDFVARYRLNDMTTEHRERAQFRRVEGTWVFVDGGPIPKVKAKAPIVKGFVPSGKKHKKKKK